MPTFCNGLRVNEVFWSFVGKVGHCIKNWTIQRTVKWRVSKFLRLDQGPKEVIP